LVNEVSLALVANGINPGGPDYSLQGHGSGQERRSWTHLYTGWTTGPVRPKSETALGVEDRRLRERIHQQLARECRFAIYSGAGRDLESIGLAWASLDPSECAADVGGLDEKLAEQVVASSIRILGDLRRFA